MAAEDAIKVTLDELRKVLSANNIVGEPIELEDKIIVPITKMGMGFGTGMSQGGDNKNASETSGGAGGGVGVFPIAVVIAFKGVAGPEGIKVVPLTEPSSLSGPLAEIASAIMKRLASKKESGDKKHEGAKATSIEVK